VRVADLEDPALAGEFHAFFGHLGLEVVDAQHAELVPGHGRLQILHDTVQRLSRLDDVQHGHGSASLKTR